MKNSIAIFIAAIVLLSNLGIAVSSHLCGGKKVETGITIAGQNFACGMAEMEEEEPIVKIPNSFSALPCCTNINLLFDVEDRYHSKLKIDKTIPAFHAGFIESKLSALYHTPLLRLDNSAYGPPKIFKNFQVAFQVFRL